MYIPFSSANFLSFFSSTGSVNTSVVAESMLMIVMRMFYICARSASGSSKFGDGDCFDVCKHKDVNKEACRSQLDDFNTH